MILTYTEYKELIYTTDTSQEPKYNKIYEDIWQTYGRFILSEPTFLLVNAGTYNATNKAAMWALLQKCLAKKIEITYVETGGADNTALGLVQRTNEFSQPADVAAVSRRLKSTYAILAQYENQLIVLLEVVADFPEYESKCKNISSGIPYGFTSVQRTIEKPEDYTSACDCDSDCDYTDCCE